MKKLLLTVAISGLMTTGASAHVNYNVIGCLDVKTIAEGQKTAGNVGQFTIESGNNVWWIYNEKTAPKTLTDATANLAKDNGFEINCTYDNGLRVKLYKKDCVNFYKH
jgi:hypothetical protein